MENQEIQMWSELCPENSQTTGNVIVGIYINHTISKHSVAKICTGCEQLYSSCKEKIIMNFDIRS